MNDRVMIGFLGIMGFCVIAITPIIPLMCSSYGIDNIFMIKALIGLLSLVCGYAIVYGFFKRESLAPKTKEGELTIRWILMLIGIGIVILAWFSNLPQMLAEYAGLASTFDYGESTGLQGSIGVRLFTSALTAAGIILCRISITRESNAKPKNQGAETALGNFMGDD